MGPFVLATANIRKELRGGDVTAAVQAAAGAELVAWQEVETAAHMHAVRNLPGFDTYWPGGPTVLNARNATPISWRADRFQLLTAGWDLAIPGIAQVTPSRFTVWCLLADRATATQVVAMSVHTVSGLGRTTRYRPWGRVTRMVEWRRHMRELRRQIATLAARYPDAVIAGGGDLNLPTRLRTAVLGVPTVYADKPTHGRRWYDLLWLAGATASNIHRVASPSDHDVLAATITPLTRPHRRPPTRPPKAPAAPPKEAPMRYPAPAPRYLGPAAHTSSGDNMPIGRVVIHSTVSPCQPGGAANIATYFRSPAAGGSAHYVVDPTTEVQVVYDAVIAWHAPPNANSLGIEMCDIPGPVPADKPGTARWKAATRTWRWTRPAQRQMLRRTARLTAQLCLAYNVPIQFVGVPGLKAGRHGITTHSCVSRAFGQSSHWDPGFWPRAWFMVLVRAEANRLRGATS